MIALQSQYSIVGFGRTSFFIASGGTPPYTYSVVAGGVGGTINSTTGTYTAPFKVGLDTIQVTDSLTATATLSIKVGTALELFCDIIQTELGLADGRVYLWDQKINQPKDSGLYVAIGFLGPIKCFGNHLKYDGSGSGLNAKQYANFRAMLTMSLISRSREAIDRKEEAIMAVTSNYSQAQQKNNSFHIALITNGTRNLSGLDGAAIPYRFDIDVAIQYAVQKQVAVDYFDTFPNVAIETEP